MVTLGSYGRDLIKLFLQFMGVALCAIPMTLIYFLALQAGANNFIARTLSLATGCLFAYFVWRFVDKKLLATQPFVLAEAPAQQAIGMFTTFSGLRLTTTLAVTIIVLPSAQLSMTEEFSKQCQHATAKLIIPQEAVNADT